MITDFDSLIRTLQEETTLFTLSGSVDQSNQIRFDDTAYAMLYPESLDAYRSVITTTIARTAQRNRTVLIEEDYEITVPYDDSAPFRTTNGTGDELTVQKFVYYLPKNTLENPGFLQLISEHSIQAPLLRQNVLMIAGALLLLLLLSLFQTEPNAKTNGLYGGVLSIPIEFRFFAIPLLLLAFFGFVGFQPMYLLREFQGDELFVGGYGSIALHIFYFGFLVIGFGFAYLCFLTFKHIHRTGFYDGVVKRSLLGNLLHWTWNKGSALFEEIKKLNFDQGEGYKLAVHLILQILLILFLFLLPKPLTFLLIIGYLAFLAAQMVQDIKNRNAIESSSKEIAKGDYSVVVDENKSPYGEIAHNFNTIREGLSTALDNEMKSERLKTELLTNVSHDLKTPLTSIISYSDLMADTDPTPEESKEYARIIHAKAEQLRLLIENLFDLSKSNSGNLPLDVSTLNLTELVRQISGEWEEQLAEKQIRIVSRFPDEALYCDLDGEKIHRVLDNLFQNIDKYTLPHTRVYIDLTKQSDHAVLQFKNIANYELNVNPHDLMQRFVRGEEARSSEGSGLGLAIADSLVSLHHGTMELDIDGDLFKVTLRFVLSEKPAASSIRSGAGITEEEIAAGDAEFTVKPHHAGDTETNTDDGIDEEEASIETTNGDEPMPSDNAAVEENAKNNDA